MKPSSFQTTIENQFDYIKRAMKTSEKNYMLYLSRLQSVVSFRMLDYLVSRL